nr:amidase family protein [Angustibacter aerolatus]
MSEPSFESATALAARLRSGETTAVEVAEDCLRRIDAGNTQVNAFTVVTHDLAMQQARDRDRALAAGAPVGPLHGVPVAIKDLFDLRAGVPGTFGSVPLKGFTPDTTTSYVQRLEDAGAVIVGKTNAPEFGHKGVTDNLVSGPTRNPFDLTRNAGGSSGGAAAAVAAGLVPLAQGTDGGGSVRIPAAWCGLFGIKPSFGRVAEVARPDAFISSSPFVSAGPLARSVGDAALMLSAMAGPHPRDPFSLPASPVDLAALPADPASVLRGLRVAWSPDLGGFPVDPRVAAVAARAVEAMAAAGARVEQVDVRLPADQQELAALWNRLMGVLYADSLEGVKAWGFDLVRDHLDEPQPGVPRHRARRARPQRDAGARRRAVAQPRARRRRRRPAGCRRARHPHARRAARREPRRRHHHRSQRGRRRARRPVHRVVPDVPVQLHRSPRRLGPRRSRRRAARRPAGGRAAARRRRRARGRCGARGGAALGHHLPRCRGVSADRRPGDGPVTMADVARLAGVSPATVSRYLNGGKVGERIGEDVRRAVDQARLPAEPRRPRSAQAGGQRVGVRHPRHREPVLHLDGARRRGRRPAAALLRGARQHRRGPRHGGRLPADGGGAADGRGDHLADPAEHRRVAPAAGRHPGGVRRPRGVAAHGRRAGQQRCRRAAGHRAPDRRRLHPDRVRHRPGRHHRRRRAAARLPRGAAGGRAPARRAGSSTTATSTRSRRTPRRPRCCGCPSPRRHLRGEQPDDPRRAAGPAGGRAARAAGRRRRRLRRPALVGALGAHRHRGRPADLPDGSCGGRDARRPARGRPAAAARPLPRRGAGAPPELPARRGGRRARPRAAAAARHRGLRAVHHAVHHVLSHAVHHRSPACPLRPET